MTIVSNHDARCSCAYSAGSQRRSAGMFLDSSLPNVEDGLGHGPVALRTPDLDEDAPDGASLLDTSLTSGRPKRQRKDCCLCCGMRYVGRHSHITCGVVTHVPTGPAADCSGKPSVSYACCC